MRVSGPTLAIDTTQLKPGLRLAVGLSGGADSVALLRALAAQSRELGLVLHAAHLHHGLRGADADADLAFARGLAQSLNLTFHEAHVDTAAEAAARPASGRPIASDESESGKSESGQSESGKSESDESESGKSESGKSESGKSESGKSESGKPGPGKSAESIEEAARRLRYGWFRQLMDSGVVDAVATAHTRDDQAETVLAKFLRGAWTEGLSGIHPIVQFPEGRILRPLLATGRSQVEAYLRALGQDWREDSSNRDLAFTRNRIRHQLLPLLEGWNPRLRDHLAQMAELARDEEAWWQGELARLAPQIILPGSPVRGGGRAAGEGLALDVNRLIALPPALQRRLLRHAAQQMGAALDFAATEALRDLALTGRAGQRCELAQGLRVERTHRELRLSIGTGAPTGEANAQPAPAYQVEIPGEILALAFDLRLQIATSPPSCQSIVHSPQQATLRNWKPGDRVRLRHSSGLRKVKEVLERLRISGTARSPWPVLELDGRIVWMRGVELEPEPGIEFRAAPLAEPLADPTNLLVEVKNSPRD